LEVALSQQVSRRGISALRRLTCFEEFIFTDSVISFYYCEDSLLGFIYKLLPHLHVAAVKPESFFNRNTMRLRDMCSNALYLITAPCTLQLRHLALNTLEDIPDVPIALPEVRVLYLSNRPDYEVQLLIPGRFPKLSELNTVHLNRENLMAIVGHGVGQQLQILRVCFRHGRYCSFEALDQFDEVLDACPNLSELCMAVKGVHSVIDLRPETLHKLRVLRMFSENWENLQPGLVMQLLRLAPNLRTVEITSAMLEEEDLEQLADLVEQRACLRHLERLQISLVTTATNFTGKWKYHLDVFIITCCSHCEQLNEVVVGEDLYQWSYGF
jgi:hypothetical protein